MNKLTSSARVQALYVLLALGCTLILIEVVAFVLTWFVDSTVLMHLTHPIQQ